MFCASMGYLCFTQGNGVDSISIPKNSYWVNPAALRHCDPTIDPSQLLSRELPCVCSRPHWLAISNVEERHVGASECSDHPCLQDPAFFLLFSSGCHESCRMLYYRDLFVPQQCRSIFVRDRYRTHRRLVIDNVAGICILCFMILYMVQKLRFIYHLLASRDLTPFFSPKDLK